MSPSLGLQEARKAQLENHEPEDEEEDMDLEKDLQDSGKYISTYHLWDHAPPVYRCLFPQIVICAIITGFLWVLKS